MFAKNFRLRQIAASCCAVFLAGSVWGGHAFAQATSGPTLQDRHPRYQIQRDDVIAITFPLSQEINQTVTVQPDGYINLQNTGSIFVQGLTAPELVLAVKKAYTGVLNDPIVNVDITDFQKPFFTVSGQVAKPGQYELRADITVSEALAVAGGMTGPTAKTQLYLYHHTPNNGVEVKRVNMKEIQRGKNLDEDSLLKPGDMVFVPEKAIANFKKYVPYGFNAGTYLNPVN